LKEGMATCDHKPEVTLRPGMRSADMDREAERRRWEEDSWRDHDDEQRAQARRDERVEVSLRSANHAAHTAMLPPCPLCSDASSGAICLLTQDINELNEQLNYERERAADAKARRAEQQREARDKLKAQFLKQQLQKLKVAKQRPKPP